MSAPYTTMWSYLWDLVDDGIGESVRRLRHDVGLDAVSVATAYHTFSQLRPRRPGAKLLREERAAVYFPIDEGLYGQTRIRPRVAPLATAGNPLAQLCAAAGDEGLDVISWTVGLHSSDLCRRYPELAQQTAYGDSLGWILCPGCDEVRAYLVALCRDLATNYGLRRIELESCNFGGYGHHHHHPKDGTPLGAVGRYLFGLSFSEGCCARARERGIDVDGLRAWVVAQLDPVFRDAAPLEGSVEATVAAHPELAAFQQLREDLVTELIAAVRAALPASTELSFLLMGDRWTGGIRPERLADHVDRLGVLAYAPTPEQVAGRLQEAVDRGVPSARHLVAGLCAYPPASPDAAALAAAARAAVRQVGVEELSFYNYGICPPACLEWVSSCIRSI